jgi:integrase
VLTRDEMRTVVAAMSGAPRLMALLMYGAGLRLLECCRLRIHDVDRGAGWVELPWALGPKYPNAGREWGWQWVFPASRFNVEPASRQSASTPSP